jgi:nanoRNase/pAp phosphatase (c-di-AMP/oligoRNAs hydrolase)
MISSDDSTDKPKKRRTTRSKTTIKAPKDAESLSATKRLKNYVESNIDKTHVAIGLHYTPDPDAIAAGLGLARIFAHLNPDIKTHILYTGEISHVQNKTMVNVLNIPLIKMDEVEDIKAFDIYCTVDCTPERSFPKDSPDCLITIDHHKDDTKKSEIIDIRSVGSTSSIIWEYMSELGIELDEGEDEDSVLATALVLGIRTDTQNLVSENTTDLEYRATQSLMPIVNKQHLTSIEDYPIPSYFFELRSRLDKEENVFSEGSLFIGGIGYISASRRDVIPAMADERKRMEGIETSIVLAIVDDHLEASVRSQSVSVDVNDLCQKIFGKEFGGGKSGAGAARVPLGPFAVSSHATEDIKDKMWEALKASMFDKIKEVCIGNS